tara:strand:- start:3210 stop:3713 length:504 start_codon:yes stop_codon:yes gene_type:complete
MTKKVLSKKDRENKDFLIKIIVVIGIILFVGVFAQNLWSDQITHKFKSPSFNGVNTSSHYLTIENQEFNRRQTIKDEIKAAIEEAERDKENSTVQRFIRNFESRVYAELSRQLIANLFGETPQDSGTITLEGNTIEYSSDGTYLTLKITEADGTITHITIPIGSFTF